MKIFSACLSNLHLQTTLVWQYWQWICFLGEITKNQIYYMKYLILAGILFSLSNEANSQTTGSNSANSTTNSSEGSSHKKQKRKKKQKATLNHRKIYKWKSGQRATPTGQEATGIGSGYSAIKKDTAGKREE
jgi:hypothetical protein